MSQDWMEGKKRGKNYLKAEKLSGGTAAGGVEQKRAVMAGRREKRGAERAHPPRATPPSNNPLLLA